MEQGNTKFYIGTNKWGRKEWVGKLYPELTREKDFYKQYVKQFNAIELHATHYKIPLEETIIKWGSADAEKDFIFCPKLHKDLTYLAGLGRKKDLMDDFLHSVDPLNKQLGPILFETEGNFTIKRMDELKAFLKKFQSYEFAMAVTNPEWHYGQARDDFFSMLESNNAIAVSADHVNYPYLKHTHLTNKKAFVRFYGDEYVDNFERINAWLPIVKSWLDDGLETLYFFIQHDNNNDTPELVDYFIKYLNLFCNLNIERPQLNF